MKNQYVGLKPIYCFTVLLALMLGFGVNEFKAQKKNKRSFTKFVTGTISGRVFNDVSGNGKFDAGESGVAGVTVSAYDSADVLQGSTVTLGDGTYSLNAGGSGPYRIEFTNFPSGFTTGKHSISSGISSPRTAIDSGTDVQFVLNGNTSDVNLALYNPSLAASNPPISPDDILQNGYAIYSKVAYDEGEATLTVRDITQLGTLIDNPANHVPNDMSAFAPITHQWTRHDFGTQQNVGGYTVYGITFDRLTGTIYTAVSPYYGWDRTPNVYKIDGKTGAVTRIATLPNNVTLPTTQDNKGFGVGAIEYDQIHQQLFVANMDDGIIYRLDADTGNILSTYDPRNTDTSGVNLAPVNELVTAIGYNKRENRIYYSMWDYDDKNHKNSTMYSMVLTAAGDFNTATNTEEFSVASRPIPANDGFYYPPFAPVTDIDFNDAEDRVLICENSVDYNPTENSEYTFVYAAHNSALFEYAGQSGNWTLDPTLYNPGDGLFKYELGDQFQGQSSRGGAAWAYKSVVNGNITGNEEYIAATADAIDWDPDNNHLVYGMTFQPATGGSDRDQSVNGANSVAVDFDDNILEHDKWVYGDLDIRRWHSPPIEIGNRVWIDANNDGMQGANEFGIAGVTVNLYRPGFGPDGIAGNGDDNDPVATTLTDINGEYYFSLVFTNAGYEIRLDNPADYASGGVLEGRTLVTANAGNDTTDSDALNITNPAGSPAGTYPVINATTPADAGTSNPSFDFGFSGTGVNPYSLGNRVWFDTNNNGVIDAAEVGVNNVSVSLFADANADGTPDDINSPIATVTTDSNGYYMFGSLADGNYVVRLNPSNFQSGGRLFRYHNSTFTESDPNNDVDSNDNGINNADMAANGILSGTVTLGPGFSEPIGEIYPALYGSGSTSGNLSQDDLANATVDFGFNRLSLSGTVFYDPLNTAFQTYWGVPQVTVRLYDEDGNVVAETLTSENDPSGVYRFDNLAEGTYTVRVVPFIFGMNIAFNSPNGGILPDPVIDPDNNVINDDNGVNGTGEFLGYLVSQPITLNYGDEPILDNSTGSTLNPTVDFGLMPAFAIGNRVWIDTDNNGVIDNGEVGVGGVSVSLFADDNADGNPDSTTPLATLTTDADGYYRFCQLYAGNYVVRVDPSNFQFGGALYGVINSTGVSGGNSDIDLADHGIEIGGPAGGGVYSQTVTLNFDTTLPPQAAEPAGEVQPVSYGTGSTNGINGLDTAENMTIDFGFYFAPTAASVSVKGKVITTAGAGIPNAIVTISGGQLTNPVSVKTNSFGYFTIPNLEVGETYVVSVKAKQYQFQPSTRLISLADEITDLTFQASAP